MQKRDFIAVRFPQEENKSYYAEITDVNADGSFDCRFVHSGNKYSFKKFGGWLEVTSSGGGFPRGTRVNKVIVYQEPVQQPVTVGKNVVVTFEDALCYLGVVQKIDASGTEVRFLHSGNTYTIGPDERAHGTTGSYIGKRVLQLRRFDDGTGLFSTSQQTNLSLHIEDGFGQPLRGEFEAVIRRADTNQVIYTGAGLSAEMAVATAELSLPVNEGQQLILLLDFHPAINPYSLSDNTSSDIDRQTTISGSKIFTYKKMPQLLFEIGIVNDVTTVTSTNSMEAKRSVQRQVSSGHSTSFNGTVEAKLEGEASLDLLVVKVGGSSGVSTSVGAGVENSTSVANGTDDSVSNGNAVSTSYHVYYPMGLKVEPAFN